MVRYAMGSLLALVSSIPMFGCSDEPTPQSAADAQSWGQSGQVGQTGQVGQVGQSSYAGGYATPTATTTAATTTAGFAIPCQADAACGTHKCNLTTQACIFPCTGAQDCAAGSACTLGLCLPGMVQ